MDNAHSTNGEESVAHPTLGQLLSARARGASDLRLAIDVAVGVVIAVAVAVWQPPAWPVILAAGLCFGAFGAWGIADRELRERGEAATSVRWLRVVRQAAALLGVLAAVALLVGVLALALGTWIS